MFFQNGNESALLVIFIVLLALAFAALIIAWIKGQLWGDLSSRKHYGEPLSSEERRSLSRSRRSCLIWSCISAALAALAFFMLR